jgi:hypothetical protein
LHLFIENVHPKQIAGMDALKVDPIQLMLLGSDRPDRLLASGRHETAPEE